MNFKSSFIKLSFAMTFIAFILSSCGSIDAEIMNPTNENQETPSVVVPPPTQTSNTPTPTSPAEHSIENGGSKESEEPKAGNTNPPDESDPSENQGEEGGAPTTGEGDDSENNSNDTPAPGSVDNSGGSGEITPPENNQPDGQNNESSTQQPSNSNEVNSALVASQKLSGGNHSYQVDVSFTNTLGREMKAFNISFTGPTNANQLTCWSRTSFKLSSVANVYVWKPTSAHYMVVPPGETRVMTCQVDLPWKSGTYTLEEKAFKSISVTETEQ